ncbi:CAAX protease family protein [Halovivax sp.]|uniref:DUF7322 domain-containing protein n=1 Tax=Halovivax sp. TaxID=1935978 RepID=UPI0025C28F2B|nr:CAAX protease family protein [Halovivax sp.]
MGFDDDFDFEPSPHEPEEWDPEAEFRDPDSDWPTIPTVSTSEEDAPREVARTFWTVVIVVNVAVLFVSLGPMLIYFWGDWRSGLTLVAGGVVLFGLAYRRYRSFMRRDDSVDDAPPTGADDGSDDGGPDGGTDATGPKDGLDPAEGFEESPDRSDGAETDSTPGGEAGTPNDSPRNA